MTKTTATTAMPESGYTDCACRDCFEVAISADMAHPELCWACEAAECNASGESDCDVSEEY